MDGLTCQNSRGLGEEGVCVETLVLTPGCWRHLPQAFSSVLNPGTSYQGDLLSEDAMAAKQRAFRCGEDFYFSLGRKKKSLEEKKKKPHNSKGHSDSILPPLGHSASQGMSAPPLSARLFLSEWRWLPGFT